jgi:hypothetical protein
MFPIKTGKNLSGLNGHQILLGATAAKWSGNWASFTLCSVMVARFTNSAKRPISPNRNFSKVAVWFK